MPSDGSHIIFNFIMFALISVLHVKFPILSLLQYAIFATFFIIGTLVLSPDLDTNSKASQRCGIACKPYKWVFHHRGASHHWLWGTAARIGYVFVICIILILIFGIAIRAQELSALGQTMGKYKLEMLAGIGGLFLSNLLHIFLDKIA